MLEQDLKMLELRENCTGIAILETSIIDLATDIIMYGINHGPWIIKVQAALELLDPRFKAIPSLKEVIVHDCSDSLSDGVAKKMRDYRLTVRRSGDSDLRLL
jgi:hypothetical protein